MYHSIQNLGFRKTMLATFQPSAEFAPHSHSHQQDKSGLGPPVSSTLVQDPKERPNLKVRMRRLHADVPVFAIYKTYKRY
ncbi:hypothetical protein BKA81DRAFT_346561 [Phyllosticta paracitricarpa]